VQSNVLFIWCVDDREKVHQSVTVGLDGRGDVAVQAGDPLCGVSVQPAQDHHAGVVGLVAVVEDEVVPGGLVAHVSYIGVCALGLTVQGER
jgi:hypothetical protein